MSATIEPTEPAAAPADADGHPHHHLSDEIDHPTQSTFVKIAIILAAITALETSTWWWPQSVHTLAMITLIVMMTVKFFMILMWFMHLKWDSKLFGFLFYIGLVLAIGVYSVALFTFHFFG